MVIEELIADIKAGRCTEAFACGTAAIITPINYLAEITDERYPLAHPEGKMGMELREKLLAIQEGRSPDSYEWVMAVEPKA